MPVVGSMTYLNQDEAEARDFGWQSVKNCYEKANHEFAKYFIVYEGYRPICTIMLQRDGNLIFFVSDTIGNHVGFIKEIKNLAEEHTSRCGPIKTKTASWYKEALRINEIVGFQPHIIYEKYEIWVYGQNVGLPYGRQDKNI